MNSKELIERLINEVESLRNKAEDKEDFFNEHNLVYQSAAIGLKVDAYNNVLRLLREAKRDVEQDLRKCYNYDSNLTDIEIKWG